MSEQDAVAAAMAVGDRVVVAGLYQGRLLWPYGDGAWMVRFDTLQRFGYRQYGYDALTSTALIERQGDTTTERDRAEGAG